MKANKQLNIIDVCSLTRQICEQINGERYAVIYETVELMKKGIPVDYKAVVACKVKEIQEAQNVINMQKGVDLENFQIPEKYCHITTYKRKEEENRESTGNISFDKQDGCPIQAEMGGEYEYVRNFFERFLKFRNKLIESGDRVKEDDIHQYFLFVMKGLNAKEKTSVLGKVKQLIKK